MTTDFVRGRFVRVMAPRWAHDPLSGAGAARNGGRWNRKGQAALYFSEGLDVAANEYEQDLGVRAGTFAYFDVDIAPAIDLTAPGAVEAFGHVEEDMYASWKDAIRLGVDPVTWRLTDLLVAAGYRAARVPSVLATNRPPARTTPGVNVVIWQWNVGPDSRATVLDPTNDLPRDAASWP